MPPHANPLLVHSCLNFEARPRVMGCERALAQEYCPLGTALPFLPHRSSVARGRWEKGGPCRVGAVNAECAKQHPPPLHKQATRHPRALCHWTLKTHIGGHTRSHDETCTDTCHFCTLCERAAMASLPTELITSSCLM